MANSDYVKCSDIMHTPPTYLYVDSTVQDTIDMLLEHHMYDVPVVDRNEVFVGEISIRRLAGLLLPTSLSMEQGLMNTSFMRETLEDIRQRLHKASGSPIEPYLNRDTVVVYPDSPLIDALMLLYHKFIRIPVVSRENGHLVGAISLITLLRSLEEAD
ncbi:CBS domain-containing protein [Mangrovimicrobium sediminis]|uniref:CBS domain-containing protein n=1 Tax=Mangrovimicrobium sediminis TaxID=2562682 RepID=A0A4Z0LZ71_9GAMM|nr:CBS domain-containing protein [Haliea sp. SAOS-164]TGD72524.1 CBS domain-containing protein [Haliea sp. SAOS-164]